MNASLKIDELIWNTFEKLFGLSVEANRQHAIWTKTKRFFRSREIICAFRKLFAFLISSRPHPLICQFKRRRRRHKVVPTWRGGANYKPEQRDALRCLLNLTLAMHKSGQIRGPNQLPNLTSLIKQQRAGLKFAVMFAYVAGFQFIAAPRRKWRVERVFGIIFALKPCCQSTFSRQRLKQFQPQASSLEVRSNSCNKRRELNKLSLRNPQTLIPIAKALLIRLLLASKEEEEVTSSRLESGPSFISSLAWFVIVASCGCVSVFPRRLFPFHIRVWPPLRVEIATSLTARFFLANKHKRGKT